MIGRATPTSRREKIGPWVRAALERLPVRLKKPSVLLYGKARDWWREIVAFLAPFAILAVLGWSPAIPVALSGEASIGTIAAVQGAVTGLSLIALVLAVELARRQEDRDDTVYEIMLRTAWIRPTFAFAIAALLATLTALAISDFSVVATDAHRANVLLSAYALTGGVGVVLLATVLRTVHVLRPTGVIEYRFQANDRERRKNVSDFISRTTNEYPTLDPVAKVLLPHRLLGLTATERLFVEVDDALQSQHAARFSGALQRMRSLVLNSADQIATSRIGFQPPGQPSLGYWFPLDALQGRLTELWRSAFARQGSEFTKEMWSFEYWLVMTGIERRSGEIVELGLRSGLIGYQAAREADRSHGHAGHEWLNLKSAAWWKLRPYDAALYDPEKEVFVPRLIEYFQEYGNMLLVADDSGSFREILSRFADAFFEREKRAWMHAFYSEEQTGPLTSFEYSILALLALAGRAMTLAHKGKLTGVKDYLNPIEELVGEFAPVERFVPAAYEPERRLHGQWEWWEMDEEGSDDFGFRWMASEQYVLLPLLLRIVESVSNQPLPSLKGFAQRSIDAWDKHQDLLLETADIDPADRGEVVDRVSARMETAKASEDRETDEIHLSAELDEGRVTRFLEKVKSERSKDRAFESYFHDVERVQRISEEAWGTEGLFASGWLLPRRYFVGDVVNSTYYEEMESDGLVRGLENGLALKLVKEIEDSSHVAEAQSEHLGDLLGAVDVALRDLGDGPCLIVFAGTWPDEVHSQLHWCMFDGTDNEVEAIESQHYQQRGVYKGHSILWFNTGQEPRIAVISLERWGYLVRAPVDGQELGVGLEEIDQHAAEERARKSLPQSASEAEIAEQVRQERLLVRAYVEERSRFEVEDPEAARIIRVAEAADGVSQSDA